MRDRDLVPCLDSASLQHDAHNSGLSQEGAIRPSVQDRGEKAGLEFFNLCARVAQTSYFDNY